LTVRVGAGLCLRPGDARGDRNFEIPLPFGGVYDRPGAKAYVERIEIRWQPPHRDYVIRREFDVCVGDAFNQVSYSARGIGWKPLIL